VSAIFLVLPLALVIGAAAVVAFIWSVRSGQLDDCDTPPRRMLLDDQECPRPAHPANARAKPAQRAE